MMTKEEKDETKRLLSLSDEEFMDHIHQKVDIIYIKRKVKKVKNKIARRDYLVIVKEK